jgi:anti-sigma regulatory factor (Ser/Thr protein kinase)
MTASAVTTGTVRPAARPTAGPITSRERTSDLTLPGSTTAAAGTARRHTHDILDTWGLPQDDVDTAMLVVSELVANAEQHTTGCVTVRLTLRRGTELLVAVRDTSPALPQQPPGARPDQESGRGLEIVDALATRHGYIPAGDHKTAWAALPVHTPADRCPCSGTVPAQRTRALFARLLDALHR